MTHGTLIEDNHGDVRLTRIKDDDHLKRILAVVLMISKAEEDVLKSYDLHANCDIVKPIDLEQSFKVVRSIEDFWLTVVRQPQNGADTR